jgi:hypothetical protein
MLAGIACLGLMLVASPSLAQDAHKGGHHRFSDPKKWSATFDDPARQVADADRIIALNLRPNELVADLGTGYMAAAGAAPRAVRCSRSISNPTWSSIWPTG